jgi:hypothetical protein
MMSHRESAELLAQALPVMEIDSSWNKLFEGFHRHDAITWSWALAAGVVPMVALKSGGELVTSFSVRRQRAEFARMGELEAREGDICEWIIGVPHAGRLCREDIVRAVRLAVSRLYDGPHVAPTAAELPQPKVALCTHGGCSELRTRGSLCEAHAAREEAAAEQAKPRAVLLAAPSFAYATGITISEPLVADDWFMVSPGPAGTFKIEALGVDERGQVTASAPVDPVPAVARATCRTPGCEGAAVQVSDSWVGMWCLDHALDHVLSVVRCREEADREEARRMAAKTTAAPAEQNLPPLTEEEVGAIVMAGGTPIPSLRKAILPRAMASSNVVAGDYFQFMFDSRETLVAQWTPPRTLVGQVTFVNDIRVVVFFPPDWSLG